MEIITKVIEKVCYSCNGVGHTLSNKKATKHLTQFDVVPCKTCSGTGIWKENYYILVSGSFAIGMDLIK